MYKSVTFELALPPHDENKVAAWFAGAAAELAAQIGDARLRGCVRLVLAAGIVDSERVLLGVSERVARLLASRLIDGPHSVTDALARWDRTCEPGRLRITVSETTPPARRVGAIARERIATAARARWASEREKAAATA